jgi:hypothetical protein
MPTIYGSNRLKKEEEVKLESALFS